MSDDSWSRLEAERRELADRAELFADRGLGAHAELLNRGGPAPGRLTETPLIVDTDVGGDPDDAVALALAARLSPHLALVITSDEAGGERARFARHLLDLVGRPEVPVVAGRQLGDTPYFCVQGLTLPQIGPQPTNVAEAVAQVCAATAGPVRWVGLAPLSNLADLLHAEPALAQRLVVTQMGGAIAYRDPARAEHNFRLDPAAARAVLGTLRDIHLVMSDTTFTPEIQIDGSSPMYQALAQPSAPAWAELLRIYMDRWFGQFHPSTLQHDALTLSAALQLPFVGFDLATISLSEDARMSLDPTGQRHFISVRARYDAFNQWLHRGLTAPDQARQRA